MKKLCENISSNGRQIFEIMTLIIAISIPWAIDLQELFKEYLTNHPISPDDFFWQVALRTNNFVASIIIFLTVLYLIWKNNKEFVMNRKRGYHDYCYAWYWICAKFLGIRSCDLVRVPIYMQFMLVIRATFSEYLLDETEYPIIQDESESIVTEWNDGKMNGEINLVLEDTYTIDNQQIPKSKRENRTIKICRNSGADSTRHFSQKYIDEITKCVRGLEENVTVNVYATTNPYNTKHIAKRVFGLGERGNVKHLYVFQQKKNGKKRFEERGRKIY